MSSWGEDRSLKLGDLVTSVGRAFMETKGVERKDIGVIIWISEDRELYKVHWQRSNRNVEMRREWLIPVGPVPTCS